MSDGSCKPESADCMLERIKREQFEAGRSRERARSDEECRRLQGEIQRLERQIQENFSSSGEASRYLGAHIAGHRCRLVHVSGKKLTIVFESSDGKDVQLEVIGERVRFDLNGEYWDHPLGTDKP